MSKGLNKGNDYQIVLLSKLLYTENVFLAEIKQNINPLQDKKNLALSKLKASADNNCNVAQMV